MKTFKTYLIGILLTSLVSYQSCSNDEKEPEEEPEEEIVNEPLENLSEDPLFTEYLSILQKPLDISRADLKFSGEIMLQYKNFSELGENISGQELANALGFENFETMVNYSKNANQLRIQLEQKYNLSSYPWGSLESFYLNGINTKSSKNLSSILLDASPPQACFTEDREQIETWGCLDMYMQEQSVTLEKHRLRAMEDDQCSFDEATFGCYSGNAETMLSFLREIEILKSNFYCCIAASCEGVDGVQDNSYIYCEPDNLLMF